MSENSTDRTIDDSRPQHAMDDGSSLKVVMLLNYLPLHFMSCMRHLRRMVGELKFLLSVPMESGREWSTQFGDFDVTLQRTISFKTTHQHPYGFDYPGKVHLPVSTALDMLRIKPDVVISLEVGARTLQALLLKWAGFRYKLIVQLRESETTAMFRGPLRTMLRKWILPRTDQVMVNGCSGRRYAMSLGVAEEKITIVPSGTDLCHFGVRHRIETSPSVLKLIYVGALIPLKGITEMVRQLAGLAADGQRQVNLTIVGKGQDEGAIRAIPLPSNFTINWHPIIEYEQLDKVYCEHDILLMPSLSDEWGMVVNEGMACGLPVIGCLGSQAVEEMVKPGENGWTYPPADPLAMRNAIVDMLATSHDRIRTMSEAAQHTATSLSDEYAAGQIMRAILRSGATQS